MRKFLYTIVFLIVLVIAGLFALRMFGEELTSIALVPSSEFVEQDPLESSAYDDPEMWFSRPGMGAQNDPARWQPAFAQGSQPDAALDGEPPRFAVFFIHSTSYFDPRQWNAPLDDDASQELAQKSVRLNASAFNQASEIWVPRYRQATYGALISDLPEASQALDAAYRDIDQAFTFFLDSIPADMPIVLAGHSQGGLLVARLLENRVAGTELQARVAMAYPIGWPISVEHDLPGLALPACEGAEQSACVMSFASFAEPATPGQFLARYAELPGNDGQARGDSPILCVNPLTGVAGEDAEMSQNLGTLVPNADMTAGELVVGAIPARCGDDGVLLIGDPPEMGDQTFPGNNYTAYDIPLFWRNLQADMVRRVSAWAASRS